MKLLFYLNIIVLIGCNSQFSNFNEIPITTSEQNIVINFSKFELNSAPLRFKLFDTRNDYLILLNTLSKTLEVYDIKENKLKSSNSYENLIGNPAIYGTIKSFEFCNYDSIFFLQDELIVLSDTVAIKERITINTDNNMVRTGNKTLILTNLDHAPLYFDSIINALSIQAYCYSCYVYNKSYYLSPIHASLFLEDYKIQELPIMYPERYLKNYYGFHNFIFRREYDDKYILSFSAEPNIFIYDKILNKVILKGGRSKFQVNEVNPLKLKYKNDSNKKLKHITLEPIYKELIFDKYRNLYYRFFLGGIDEKNPDGSFNGWQDKELILMIFDYNFNLITEVILGNDTYNSSKSFVTSQGLFLFKFNNNSKQLVKDKIYYDILEIH